jgi:hypothetical protein
MRSIYNYLFTVIAAGSMFSVNAQGVVINEVDVIVTESNPQFIELYGSPNSGLEGFSIAVVKSIWSGGGAYGVEVYSAISLEGMQFDSDGFLTITADLAESVGAVAIYEADISIFIVGEEPPTEDIIDALVYGNVEPSNPQVSGILQALVPPGTGLLYEGAEENPQGHSLARLPDGGEPFDLSSYAIQPPSQGTTNILACAGGFLELTNAANDTLCTDQGPAIATFNHITDAPTGSLTLLVVDPVDGVILSSASGSAVNFEGLGDGLLDVVAVSHDSPLDANSIQTGMPLSGVTSSGCFSLSEQQYVIFIETCESPACDGGTMLDASGSDEVLACLTPDGTIVAFGYYSEAVEDDFLFAICTVEDTIITTIEVPFYDFTDLGVNDYHVWGISTQGEIDPATIAPGAFVGGATALECDSIGASALFISILECGEAGLCDDLIISEYVEGDSHNKAIELFNPSEVEIDLTPYTMELYNNGATEPNQELNLTGSIPQGGTYVIGNSQATPALQNLSDVTSQLTWYNGNDALVLSKNGEAIDIMGVVGQDPGDAWTVSSGGAMAEHTLVRKPNVGHGTTDWEESQAQWDSYPQDTFDFLGSHQVTCGGLGTMSVGFDAPELYVNEGGGVTVSISPIYPIEDVEVELNIVGGDAITGIDFPDVFPLSFNFEMGLLNSQSFNFTAIDEEAPELQEDVLMALSITSGGAILGIDTLVIHILPSDLEYPVYEIDQVRGTNPQGVLDSIGVACELRGIVHGWNDYPSGLQFTLIDPTNGINIFSPISDFGYDVVEGDSVRVRGVIDQYLGLAQIRIDTLLFEGSGFPSDTPQLVFEMDEETESRIVTLKCTELVDLDDWTNTTPGFDVRLAFGAQEIIMRIDANTNLFGTIAPAGVFGVTGIGGQRDPNAPFVDGYMITPRGQFDLTDPVNADFIINSPWDGNSGPLEIFNLSTGAENYLWNMGDGTTYNDTTPSHNYTEAGTFTIYLTAFSENGDCSSQASFEVVSTWVRVEEFSGIILNAFPNPTKDKLTISTKHKMLFYNISDALGRVVKSENEINSNTFEVDASSLNKGVYSISVQSESGIGLVRFIKN